ncbi:hypothetical protein JHN49_29810, partial [Streptomyces sp. MBT57]|nr:hypothetical protein [Streptomyces sp. MBT57]
ADTPRSGQHHVPALAPRPIGPVPHPRTRLERRSEPRHLTHPHRPPHGLARLRRRIHVHVTRHLGYITLRPRLLTRTTLP